MCSSSLEPTYVRIDWEADGAPYLAIARPGRPVERIPLSRATVARLVADGAGWIATDGPARYNPPRSDYTDGPARYNPPRRRDAAGEGAIILRSP